MNNIKIGVLESLRNLNIVIVTHVFATGPAQELDEYLRNKVHTLMFIGHPFYYATDVKSFYNVYNHGESTEEKKARALKLPEPILYIKDVIYTFFWITKLREHFNIYIGADPLNAFSGLLLKKIRRIDKVVLYTVDYVPERFTNSLLDFLYHWLDSYCVTHSDQVWNLSQRMLAEREKRSNLNNGKQKIVPIGVHFGRIERLSLEKIDRKCIVYVGHLRKMQGLELIITTLPKILEKVSDVKLIVIGTGELEGQLRDMCKELKVEEHVEFKGFIEDHKDVEKILIRCAVGLAPYEPNPNSFTWYADPSKPKQYMACGLPIIITRVPWIAEEIEKRTAGVVINYNNDEFSKAVIKLLTNDNYYEICRRNATEFASELDWDRIFDNAFLKLRANSKVRH